MKYLIRFCLYAWACSQVFGNTQEIPDSSAVTGEGVQFSITQSAYLNVDLQSDTPLRVYMQTASNQVELEVSASDDTTSQANLTLHGLPASTSIEFLDLVRGTTTTQVSDGAGSLAFVAEVAGPNVYRIQWSGE